MSIDIIIQGILALGTILGGAIAAYATYKSTNSSVKVQEKQLNLEAARVSKELNSFGIEEAERISSISLSNLQFMQQQFSECAVERDNLQDEVTALTLANTKYKVKLLKLAGRLKSSIESLKKLSIEKQLSCPEFDVVESILFEILTELEVEQ